MKSLEALFDAEAVNRAQLKLQKFGRTSLAPAFRFQYALRALLMDASRNQRQGGLSTVFAVDPVEIVSIFDDVRPRLNAFTFSGFIDQANNPAWSQSLVELDSLISHFFLANTVRPFLILDSYFNELLQIRENYAGKLRDLNKLVIGDAKLAQNKFEGFQKRSIENIRDFILRGRGNDEVKNELSIFTKNFMPHWRIDLVDTLLEQKSKIDTLDNFLRHSNFVHLRNEAYGNRALERLLPNFQWDVFENYIQGDQIAAEFNEVRSVVQRLAGSVSKFGKSVEAIDQAALNDGLALADIHILNSFLEHIGDDRRVELVTRSNLLANILLVLPSGKLKVQLRHPLLLPEVFRFDELAIAEITRIARRFNDVMTPYLERFEEWLKSDDIDHIFASKVVSNMRDLSIEAEEKLALEKAAEIGRDFAIWMLDSSLIQVSSTTSVDALTAAYQRTLNSSPQNAKKAPAPELVQLLKQLFHTIIANFDSDVNPLTHAAMKELVKRNETLAAVVWQRTYAKTDRVQVRLISLAIGSVASPIPCIALRMIGGRLTRIVHLHSSRATIDLRKFISKTERAGISEPIEISLTRKETIEQFSSLILALADDAVPIGDDDHVYMIDVTLIVAAALASQGEISTAISLSSTVLHELMSRVRRSDVTSSIGNMSTKLRLAYRELLLFRHYCERQTAFIEFVSQNGGTTVSYIRGSVERNFARAQRDLDLAADLGQPTDLNSASNVVSNIRLRFIHMSGWMDMYLLSSRVDFLAGHDSRDRPLVRLAFRRDIWVAVGMVKECIDDVTHLRQLRKQHIGDNDTARYIIHIKARLLQNALTMFLLLLFSKDVPLIERQLDPNLKVHPEHILKFVDWKSWWQELQNYVTDLKFRFRLVSIIAPVAEMLIEIDRICSGTDFQISPNDLVVKQNSLAAQKAWSDAIEKLNSIDIEHSGFSLVMRDHIIAGLNRQLVKSGHQVSLQA